MTISGGLQGLDSAIRALGTPLDGVADVTGQPAQPEWYLVPRPDGRTLRIDFGVGATAAQQAAARSLALTISLANRVPRLLLDIVTDLNALTPSQKQNVWGNLSSGVPPKWELDAGPNAAAVAVLAFVAGLGGLSAADVLNARLRGVAMYVQDNPRYLVQPSFDTTINIPGDQPA